MARGAASIEEGVTCGNDFSACAQGILWMNSLRGRSKRGAGEEQWDRDTTSEDQKMTFRAS